MQKHNSKRVKEFYNWNNFRKTIRSIVLSKIESRDNKKFYIQKKLLKKFKDFEKRSSNYHLKPSMILILIKANVSILIKKILLRFNH